MKRSLRISAIFLLLCGSGTAALAQTPAPAGPDSLLAEIRSLKRLVELQTKELNGLSEQVARLRQQLEVHDPAEAHEPAAPAAGSPAPVESTPPAPAGETPAPEPPRAEATGGGIKHLVAKGETLTSIAKHYNVPLTELQKANKGLEARKMQIGQVLNIPAAATPAPAAPETPAPAPTH